VAKPRRTFRQFLYSQRKRDDPIGDLARDAIQDRYAPWRTVGQFLLYLEEVNACQGAIEAARQATREWSASDE
jgi:hypothetical protein